MATQEPVLVEINFSGSSSNKTSWRRVSSDGGAQIKADNVGGKSPGILLVNRLNSHSMMKLSAPYMITYSMMQLAHIMYMCT